MDIRALVDELPSVLDRFSRMSTFLSGSNSWLHEERTLIPSSRAPRKPSRQIVLLTKIKTATMGVGARTLGFFRKGEELEATGFETLPFDDPMLVPPKLGFRGFDKVPRNHAPLVITVLLIAVGALTVFGWRSVRNVPNHTAGVATSVPSKAPGDWSRPKASPGARPSTP